MAEVGFPPWALEKVLDGGYASTKHDYLLPWPCVECQGAKKMRPLPRSVEDAEVGDPCGRTASTALEEMMSELGSEDWGDRSPDEGVSGRVMR